MDIHVTYKTNKYWEVVYAIKSLSGCSVNIESARLFRRFGEERYKQKKCSVLCCRVIDACSTSNDV